MPIGTIRLNTTMQRSKFGDERLFFAHMRMEFDMDYYPGSWKKWSEDPKIDSTDDANLWTYGVPEMDSSGGWPSDDAGAQTMWDQQINDHGCPFYWLLEHAGLA